MHPKQLSDTICPPVDGVAVPARLDPLFGRPAQTPAPVEPIRRTLPKIGRNDPCLCGSGKKFKKCCLPELQGL